MTEHALQRRVDDLSRQLQERDEQIKALEAGALSVSTWVRPIEIASKLGQRVCDVVEAETGERPTHHGGRGESLDAKHHRWLAYYLAHREGATMARIGRIFGTNHTTVGYALKRLDADRRNDCDLNALLVRLERRMRGEDPRGWWGRLKDWLRFDNRLDEEPS